MRVSEDLKDGVAGVGGDVAGFVVEREERFFDVGDKVEEGWGNGVGDWQFVADDGVDLVLDPFKGLVAGHLLADFFGEFDFAPGFARDEVGGVDEVGGFAHAFGLGLNGGGHGVVGAREEGFGVDVGMIGVGLDEFFAKGAGDGDDGNLGFLEELFFLVEGFLEVEFGHGAGVGEEY